MKNKKIIIIGAGFSGLSIAYELTKLNYDVSIFDESKEIGGLAGSFDVGQYSLEKFYHHWFTSDIAIMELIKELNLENNIKFNNSKTGLYFANNFYKLSKPTDLLNFKPLNIIDRFRFGIMVLRARSIKDWKQLENKTAKEWLCELGGKQVYKIIWEPLLKGKFGVYAEKISAVWFWNKLKLRGGSRNNKGEEKLAYFKGGFSILTNEIKKQIEDKGGKFYLSEKVIKVDKSSKEWSVITNKKTYIASDIILTTAPNLASQILGDVVSKSYKNSLNKIKFLGNICLVLELTQSLSDTYWLNVNDPSFPFVGIIEHTNFESPENYGGRHIVYLSKYLTHEDKLFLMNSDEVLNFALPHILKMFPKFNLQWIKKHYLWKEKWAQPVVTKNYSKIIPSEKGPLKGLYLCTMAQVYPEDRGTNYSIRNGKKFVKTYFDKG